jgi:glyoxylase-like metal-dependent hydrolase (beta-lactamase superfamily II)
MAEDLASKVSGGKVAVIREGYDREGEKGRFHAKCSVTLIRAGKEGELLSLVDAGREKDKDEICHALLSKGVLPGQIEAIFLTHNHPDHMLGVVNFNANVYAPDSVYNVGNYKKSEIDSYEVFPKDFQRIGAEIQTFIPEIKLIATHGHSGWDMSVVYQKGNGPKIAMVGDLFWSEQDFYEDNRFTDLCEDSLKQEISRGHVREVIKPGVIVPGHGAAFEVRE